jgi:hypothetical protein
MMWLKINGTDIDKRYLDPMQAYPKDRAALVKIHLWPNGKKKSECKFKADKKKIKDLDNKDIDVDGDVELK